MDNATRTLHGALLDCELLAAVYLSLTRGQESLSIGLESRHQQLCGLDRAPRAQPILLIATTVELTLHEATLLSLQKESRGRCLWLEG